MEWPGAGSEDRRQNREDPVDHRRTSKPELLIAAQTADVTFIRDRRRRGLAALSVADRDITALLGAARSARRMRNALGNQSGAVRVRSQGSAGMAE